jgi:hypothetical protein
MQAHQRQPIISLMHQRLRSLPYSSAEACHSNAIGLMPASTATCSNQGSSNQARQQRRLRQLDLLFGSGLAATTPKSARRVMLMLLSTN